MADWGVKNCGKSADLLYGWPLGSVERAAKKKVWPTLNGSRPHLLVSSVLTLYSRSTYCAVVSCNHRFLKFITLFLQLIYFCPYWYLNRSYLCLIIRLGGKIKWFFTSENHFLIPPKQIIRHNQDLYRYQ